MRPFGRLFAPGAYRRNQRRRRVWSSFHREIRIRGSRERSPRSKMRLVLKFVISAALLAGLQLLSAQDLRPRAYVITPEHSNVVILGYAFNNGSIFFGTVLPITNASGRYSVPNISYYHSLSFFKRSANFTATLPYVVGNFQK
jgi:hypothetical protein